MKILRIYFKNIHSLKGTHSIDFTKPPLADTGIFAIIGDTGSGKSTLLDVIMLALYGQMPRFDEKISKSTVEKFGTVMTRGTDEAMAEVEYRTNGKEYRSRWSIRRNRNGNLNDYTMELSQLPDGQILVQHKRDVPKQNEKIIGLNYQQFLKSIILAQGDFAKFLKAKPEERTNMLEKITGTEIYRLIGRRAFEIAREHSKELELLNERLNDFKILTDDERTKIEIKKKDLDLKIKKLKQNLEIWNKKILLKTKINELNKKLEELNKKFADNETDIKNFENIENKINLHNHLIKYSAEIETTKNILQDITTQQEKFKELSTRQKILFSEKENFDNLKNNLSADIQIITQKIEQLLPFAKEYKEILQKIELETQNLSNKKDTAQRIANNITDINLKINNLQAENKNTSEKLHLIETKLQENTLLENLSIDFAIIEQSLNDYNSAKNITQKAINNSSFNSYFEKNKWNNYSKIAENLLSEINSQISKIELSKPNKSTAEIQTEIDKKISEIQIVEKLKDIALNISKIQEKINLSEKERKQINNQIEAVSNLLTKTSNELTITEKRIEELEKRLEREQLEAKYEQDRLKLIENEPCPLCGAIHHPFAKTKHPISINKTKQELNSAKKLSNKLNNDKTTLITKKTQLETQTSNIKKTINDFTSEKTNLLKNFDLNSKKLNKIFNYIEIDKLNEYHKKILQDKKEIENTLKAKQKFDELTIKSNELKNLNEKITNVILKHQQAHERLKKYKKYYENAKNIDEILSTLTKLINDFNNDTKLQLDLSNKIQTNNKLINELENQKNTLKKQEKNINNELKKLSDNLQNLLNIKTNISKNYFNGQDGDNFIDELNEKLNKNNKKLSEITNKLATISAQISEIDVRKQELSTSTNEKQEQYQQKHSALIVKLQQIGINSIDEASENILPQKIFEQYQAKKQLLHDTKVSINQAITETKDNLDKLNKIDDKNTSLEDILLLAENAKNQIDNMNKELGRATNIIDNDNYQRKNFAELTKKIKTKSEETTKWEKLSKLIGDAQGKRFAQIAQQFTMTQLINKANIYLAKLNDRYKLAKTNEFKHNLFVYDLYMGMNKRSVHTLSGGETFLVSLALALALSDLASQKTRIESLFIDEGFGTLDIQTLNMALNVLEHLHSDTNRTIALISHVQDIKERISTQIILEKDTSGFSSIKIL